jgi:hypothetical protein
MALALPLDANMSSISDFAMTVQDKYLSGATDHNCQINTAGGQLLPNRCSAVIHKRHVVGSRLLLSPAVVSNFFPPIQTTKCAEWPATSVLTATVILVIVAF